MICYAHTDAQTRPVENYLQQAGDYANLYNGEIETHYNIVRYSNMPYYESSDFTDAFIVYRKSDYPHQKVRLDLYKEQLIVLPPEKQYGIVVNTSNINKIVMYGKTFEWLVPPKESGLKAGFYIHLSEGKKLQLYRKEYFYLQQELTTYRFDRSIKYYLVYNDRYYPVKNKGSLSKLFPQYKKQINQRAKERVSDFKPNAGNASTLFADYMLVSLASYCDELLTSTSRP